MSAKKTTVKKAVPPRARGIMLTGRIVNGKVVLDKSCRDKIAKRFPKAQKSFVAVNAPFDPNSTPDVELTVSE